MESVTQLMIRACKSRDPYRRLHSVHRRFYLRTRTPADLVLAQQLSRICDDHLGIRVTDLVSDYHPDNLWRFSVSQDDDHWSVTVRILVSHIRDAPADRFQGLATPAAFRKLETPGGPDSDGLQVVSPPRLKREYEGRQVRTRLDLHNGWGTIPAGSVGIITKQSPVGSTIHFLPCSACGLEATVSRVESDEFEFVKRST